MFQTVETKRIKEKNISFWFNIKYAPPGVPPLPEPSVLAIIKGYFPVFPDIITASLMNLFIWLDEKTPTKFLLISSSSMFFRHFQWESYWFPCLFFIRHHQKDYSDGSLLYFVFLLRYNLFLILHVPYLYSSGACFIPSSTNFFPVQSLLLLHPYLFPILLNFLLGYHQFVLFFFCGSYIFLLSAEQLFVSLKEQILLCSFLPFGSKFYCPCALYCNVWG